MKKERIIISAVGMPKEQMKQIEDEMNDPNTDKWVWIFDKPTTVSDASTRDANVGFSYSDALCGWTVFKTFKDDDKNIIRIVLERDGELKEYKLD